MPVRSRFRKRDGYRVYYAIFLGPHGGRLWEAAAELPDDAGERVVS